MRILEANIPIYTYHACRLQKAALCKECTLLMAAEGYGFEEAVYRYDRLMDHLGWEDKGKILCGGVFDVGDIEVYERLREVYELGNRL